MCRILIALGSTLAGIGVIISAIFISKAIKNKEDNKTYQQTVNDYEYQTYLQQYTKQLDVWSNTNLSKIKNLPAYEQFYTNDSQINLLANFLNKHNYQQINLYMGSAQYDSTQWVVGNLPAEQKRSYFIDKLLQQRPNLDIGGVIYLNDQPQNTTNYHMVQYFAEALKKYNSIYSNQIKKISLFTNCNTEVCGIQTLDSLAILRSSLPSDYDVLLNAPYDFYYLQLEDLNSIKQVLVKLPQYVEQQNISYVTALQNITNKTTVQIKDNNMLHANKFISNNQHMNQINIRFAINNNTCFSGGEGLDLFQYMARSIYDPQRTDLQITIGPEDYLRFYQLMYKKEPLNSNTNCQINLYIE